MYQPIDCLGDELPQMPLQATVWVTSTQVEVPAAKTPWLDAAMKPAFVTLLVGLVLVAIFEVWALKTGHNTWSHMFQRLSARWKWFRALGASLLAVLIWHLFWGFPWDWEDPYRPNP